jgi:hypothetical protein
MIAIMSVSNAERVLQESAEWDTDTARNDSVAEL